VELTGEDLSCCLNYIQSVGLWNVCMITSSPTKRISAISQWKNICQSFTHKMELKLHHCHPMYCFTDKHEKNVDILRLNLFTASLLVRSKSVKCYLLSNMLWMLSVSLRNTAHAACSTVQLLQYKTSSAAQRWTHMITVQDLWSHTALWIWVASQQYWRNQAATGWTPANH